MKFLEYAEKIETMIYLVERCRTGSPRELAYKLNVSERTVYRMVQQLRDRGHRIIYDRYRNSYVVDEDSE